MSRVMLVCPEPLRTGEPAGIGIRFLEIAKALVAAGHEVTMLSPDGGAAASCAAMATDPSNIHAASGTADVAVVQGHIANDFFAHAQRIPTVVDLYDPFIIENLHYFAERGAEVFTHDHATLVRSLLGGDFFLCASEAQRLFYLGMLLAVGRVNPVAFEDDPRLASLIAVVPFGVGAPQSRIVRVDAPAILFGGIYDWYDPITAIEAVSIARRSVPGVRLTFTRHPNPDITPQGKLADAIAHVQKRGFDFVDFVPWTAYERRGELFERHAMALLTFPQSLETELSMRTRIYDYLWAGLPIVTSSAPGTDEILERYGAGLVIRDGTQPSRPLSELFASAIVAMLTDQARRAAMRAATQAFVAEHQWARTLAPLLDFCAAPRIDPAKEAFAVHLETPQVAPSLLDRIRRRIGGRS